MNMVGDMGRYTQFQVAQSVPIAAANEGGGGVSAGVGIGAGLAMGQQMMNAMRPPTGPTPAAPVPSVAPIGGGGAPAGTAESKFCINCGKSMPRAGKFCPECGTPQQ
jgi:membrane protease subunit (stomatin/prohibitin family)